MGGWKGRGGWSLDKSGESVGRVVRKDERGALEVKDGELSADVRRLQKELEEANKLLNAMIDIA